MPLSFPFLSFFNFFAHYFSALVGLFCYICAFLVAQSAEDFTIEHRLRIYRMSISLDHGALSFVMAILSASYRMCRPLCQPRSRVDVIMVGDECVSRRESLFIGI